MCLRPFAEIESARHAPMTKAAYEADWIRSMFRLDSMSPHPWIKMIWSHWSMRFTHTSFFAAASTGKKKPRSLRSRA